MQLKLFTETKRLDEYLQVLVLSCLRTPPKVLPIDVSKGLKNEIERALEYTRKLPPDFKLNVDLWVLYALYNDSNEIIGTIALSEERHISGEVQVEYVAIRQDYQGKGLGQFLIQSVIKEAKAHSAAKHIVLATGAEGAFYEAIGMTFAGEVVVGDRHRHFYIQKI